MAYTLNVTVNKANGTDYDMETREVPNQSELITLIHRTLIMAEQDCIEQSTFPPSSLILTIVQH